MSSHCFFLLFVPWVLGLEISICSSCRCWCTLFRLEKYWQHSPLFFCRRCACLSSIACAGGLSSCYSMIDWSIFLSSLLSLPNKIVTVSRVIQMLYLSSKADARVCLADSSSHFALLVCIVQQVFYPGRTAGGRTTSSSLQIKIPHWSVLWKTLGKRKTIEDWSAWFTAASRGWEASGGGSNPRPALCACVWCA